VESWKRRWFAHLGSAEAGSIDVMEVLDWNPNLTEPVGWIPRVVAFTVEMSRES